MHLLICAATGTEARACRSALAAPWLKAAGATAEVLVTGVGLARAKRSIARRLAAHEQRVPALVISSGFAGSLSPGLRACDWLLSDEIYDSRGKGAPVPIAPPGSEQLHEAVLRAFTGVKRARIVSVEKIGAGVPASLRGAPDSATPWAVDMESAALALECAQRGIPFFILRFVTDTPEAPLPPFVAAFTDAICASTPRARAGALARGIRGVLKNPAVPLRFVRQGIRWSQGLARGWAHGVKLK